MRNWIVCPAAFPLFGAGIANAAEEKAEQVFDPAATGSIAQIGLSLLIVVVIILAMAWLLRRLGQWQPGGSGAIQVLGGQSVGQRERIVLVQVGEEQLLLGVAPGRVQTLHKLEKPVRVERNSTGGFAERFNQALKREPS